MNTPAAESPVLEAVGRCGALSYEFEHDGRRTILTRSSCTSPWHYFPPSYLDDSGCACTWLVNPSGGLVGGDHLSVVGRLHTGAHVLMTSPSATRVYRSLSEPAIQEVRVSLGLGARLEWLPEVTIPFAGARFRQSILVDLAPGATVVLWDAIASGRIAMGERWAFARVENEIHIRTAAGRSAIERFQVTPETVGRIAAEWDYVASLFVIGDEIDSGTLSRLKDASADLLERWPGEVLGGVSEPAAPGLAIKLVARSAPGLTKVVESLAAVVRAELWQLPAAVLRRY